MLSNKLRGKPDVFSNTNNIPAPVTFYSLHSTLNNGGEYHFNKLAGKKVLIVNTASDCGFTEQYAQLQQLQGKFKDSLVVIGFPSNDFKKQEKGSDEQIAAFCKIRFGVTFPLMQKTVVKKQPDQNSIYAWLSNKRLNGWNDRQPGWNFTKYLVNENGVLTHYFPHGMSPLDKIIIAEINAPKI